MEVLSPFASLLTHWSKAGTAIGPHDWKQTGAVVEAAKTVLWDKAKALVDSARLRPILFCYGCDGTPICLTGTFVSSFGGAAVRRRGGDGQELLIQRGYVVTKDSVGEIASEALLRDIVPLSAGKGSWNCFTAATQFFPHLRQLGARSIIISSTCFDRALQSSMSRLLAQRQALYYQVKHGAGAYQGDALFEVLTDWSVSTGCSAHDAQNALKWGMVGCVPDTAEALKGLYIGLESLRNGFSLLASHLDGLLQHSLAFVGEEHPSVDLLFTLWSDVGLEPDLAQELADTGLLWQGGRLCVRGSLQGDDGLRQRLRLLYLKVMQFRKFTESRWITIGVCSRRLVASMLIGLSGLADRIRDDPAASGWYIHGFWDYVTPDVLRYAIVASLASRPVDAALGEMLSDDRCAGRYGELCEEMQVEWDWLCNISQDTWGRLAAICGPAETPEDLRTQCCLSALGSSCFLHWRVMRNIRSYPWKLVEGDVQHNLDELMRHPEPAAEWDDTTRKIYTLLRLQPVEWRDRVVEALMLLKEIPWSTAGVEQGHASAAIVSRLHPMSGLDSVADRAFCHSALPLLQDKGREKVHRKIEILEGRLARLRTKTGSGVSGRQIFFEDMVTGLVAAGDDRRLSQELKVWAMGAHVDDWKRLSPADHDLYNRRAALRRQQYQADVDK